MIYTGETLRELIFPLGGIGTGSIGLSGNGTLVDWEIYNRPAKGSINGYTHIGIRAEWEDGRSIVRILNSDYDKYLSGQYTGGSGYFSGYGFGPAGMLMCGFSHFESCSFDARFPIATLSFEDGEFPARAVLTAFNPMIPGKADDSSLPAAFFKVALFPKTQERIRYSVFLCAANMRSGGVNSAFSDGEVKGIFQTSVTTSSDDFEYSDMTVAGIGEGFTLQEYWYRGIWKDGISTYWREVSEGSISERHYSAPTEGVDPQCCSVIWSDDYSCGEAIERRLVIAWSSPNMKKYWEPRKKETAGMDLERMKSTSWKNYYATKFESSRATAKYCLLEFDRLLAESERFADALHGTTIPEALLDAAISSLAVLKSPTVFRLEDGSFYGWEGVKEQTGSCEGTCQHVYNYAYALCFLFPDLERSIRDLEFRYSTEPSGKMGFRLILPLGSGVSNMRACLDGQMGAIIKAYREWKISGDDRWLESNYATLKKILAYAWSEDNPDRWDRDRDGVLEGRQHHTLDMELFGPSSWLEGFYLAALSAMAEIADYLGHGDDAAEYRRIYESGYAWTRENLFNGKYFIQKIDLNDDTPVKSYPAAESYWHSEAGELKYQIGDGCEIDQLLAQWHAALLGLGDVFDREQRAIAVRSIFENNFKPSMREVTNLWRIFALNDEGGTIICDYPEGAYKPVVPIPYCEEVMTGFEYAFAGLLLSEGMIAEAETVVRAVRDRYDGEKRNPFNEIECGSNYARAMAAFSFIPLAAGFEFDMPHGRIGFSPIMNKESFRCFFSLREGWGIFSSNGRSAEIEILGGSLTLAELGLGYLDRVERVEIDGAETDFSLEGGYVKFERQTINNKIKVY